MLPVQSEFPCNLGLRLAFFDQGHNAAVALPVFQQSFNVVHMPYIYESNAVVK